MEERDAMHARRKTGEALLSCIHLLGGFNRLGTEDQGEDLVENDEQTDGSDQGALQRF